METREHYSIDAAIERWFQVELIDSKGRSHGFIGYRFNEAGAQAACSGWNNDRDRGDLVAVIKPFEPTNSGAVETESELVDTIALNAIADLFNMGSEARKVRCKIVDNVRNLCNEYRRKQTGEPGKPANPLQLTAEEQAIVDELAIGEDHFIRNGRFVPLVREAFDVSANRIVMTDEPTAKLRGHKRMLIKSLEACLRAMNNGYPHINWQNRWRRAKELAGVVLKTVAETS